MGETLIIPNEKPSILIVDDVATHIKILAECLQDDYAVFMAIRGADALSLAKFQKPDLILLDVVMPFVDGFKVFEMLQADAETCAIPVIFLTSLAEVGDIKHGLSLGAADYIVKPIDPLLVRERVQNVLERKRALVVSPP